MFTQYKKSWILITFLICNTGIVFAQFNAVASHDLIKRILPSRAALFTVEQIPSRSGKDVFEIAPGSDKIILRGSSGVAIASALYYYLQEYCHCQVTWNGTNITVPAVLPKPATTIHKETPYEYRYYLNYCTFNYSMSWWNWERWEKEIDWMALHGINMPLAITGEEYTWYEVYKEMGFSNKELSNFFSGPAYFSWFWMGNLDAWGGPLPLHWMETHKELQKKILKRQRELGMKPILPAFTGHVPAAFKTRFPNAKLKTTNWTNGFADTYILDAHDPLFAEIGKKFLEKQQQLFGTDHFYSADTFNENEPPSNDPGFLKELSAKVYEGMKAADSAAVWVMQGWLFYSDRKFWNTPQIEALLSAVPGNHMLLLDLAAEIEPVWKRTQAFYGKPWIWNMLHNFGGNNSMFGRMDGVATGPADALHDPLSGNLKGIGLTMEAIEQTPVMYELMMQHTWQTTPVNINDWLKKYILNRYGTSDKKMFDAWQVLRETVYNGREIRDGAESILTGRPTLDSATRWTKTKLNYPRAALLPAWDLFINAISECGRYDGFQYDLVDITRQVLANYAYPLQKKWVRAYEQNDTLAFDMFSHQFSTLISDMDKLLATRKDFLLGPWIADARRCGITLAEKNLYEKNARNLITLWGDANSPLHEYSCRQWSGLLNEFYKPRWDQFFTALKKSMRTGQPVNIDAFEKKISQWEWNWVNEQKAFPVMPSGNSVVVAKMMYDKYRKAVE